MADAPRKPMRRLTAEGCPLTRMAVIRDAETHEALWAGPQEDMAAAVLTLRMKERDGDG